MTCVYPASIMVMVRIDAVVEWARYERHGNRPTLPPRNDWHYVGASVDQVLILEQIVWGAVFLHHDDDVLDDALLGVGEACALNEEQEQTSYGSFHWIFLRVTIVGGWKRVESVERRTERTTS